MFRAFGRIAAVGTAFSAIAVLVACSHAPPPKPAPQPAPPPASAPTVAAAPTVAPPPPGPALDTLKAGRMQIHTSLDAGFCVDDNGSGFHDGNQIFIWSCHAQNNQAWSFIPGTDGSDVITGVAHKCLAIRSDPSDKRGATALWTCNGSPSQTFKHYADGTFHDGVGNNCLTAKGGSKGAIITLEPCTPANAGQIWSLTQAPEPTAEDRIVIEDARVRLNEEILFKTGSHEIDPRSDEFIAFIAHVLKEHPGLDYIEVGGHADARGAAGENLALTQKRADEVVKHLAANGVDPHRLRGVGYSSYCPMDPAENEEAYAKNRRVEFQILRRDGHDLKTKWDGCDGATAHKMKPLPIPKDAPKTKLAKH